MKYITLLIIITFNFSLKAQSNFDKSKKISILLDLSSENSRTNQDSATIYAKEALELAKAIDDNLLIARSHELLGQAYRYGNQQENARKNYAEAIKFYGTNEQKIAKLQHWTGHTYAAESEFKKAIKQYQITNEYAIANKDTTLLGNCALDIGVIYARQGAFYVAIEYFFSSIEYYDAINDTRHIVPLLNNIGSIYLDTKNYEKGLIFLKKAEERLKSVPGQKDDYAVHIATNIGICYNNLKEFDKAISYYELALSEAERIDDSFIKVTVYNQLGALFVENNEIEQAQKFYRKAYDLSKKENYQAEYAAVLKGFAIISKKKGNYTEALRFIEESNAINIKLDNLDNVVSDYELLASIHDKLGNSAKAYDYMKDYITLKDSVFNIDKEAEISLMESKYNYKQEELKLITEVQNLKRDKKLHQSRQTILILILFLISIILSTLFWFLSKNRKENNLLKKHLENKEIIEQQSKELKLLNEGLEIKVQERTNELQTVNQNLEQANYELRTFNYIASHDIKEPIRVISGYASLIFKKLSPELKENLGDYFTTINRSTKQLYTLIEDFARYTTLSKDELISQDAVDLKYITFMVTDNLRESIQKYNGQIILHEFPMVKSNTSFLITILKNLIENGLKYNRSENPTVEISYQATDIHHQIIISDNGIGIDITYHDKIFEVFKRLHNRVEYEGTGIGLAIVKLCVTKLKGEISLESKVAEGSKFIISLPKK